LGSGAIKALKIFGFCPFLTTKNQWVGAEKCRFGNAFTVSDMNLA
jgi:hypothetical protein